MLWLREKELRIIHGVVYQLKYDQRREIINSNLPEETRRALICVCDIGFDKSHIAFERYVVKRQFSGDIRENVALKGEWRINIDEVKKLADDGMVGQDITAMAMAKLQKVHDECQS